MERAAKCAQVNLERLLSFLRPGSSIGRERCMSAYKLTLRDGFGGVECEHCRCNVFTLKRVAEHVATKPYTWSKLTLAYS